MTETDAGNVAIAAGTDNCSNSTVMAGSGCTVAFTMTPAAMGTVPATVNVTDAAGNWSSPITGTGLQAVLSGLNASYAFGSTNVGVATAPVTITLTNAGNENTSVSTPNITNPDFNITTESCSGANLAPNATCALQVVFQPASTGPKSATLSVTSTNASPSTITSQLTGTGTSPGLAFNPNPLAFGGVTQGASTTLTETATNSGTGPLTITSITPHGDYTTSADTCSGTTLNPGDHCTVNVTFAPSAQGDRSATITWSGSGAFQTVLTVTGTGLAPAAIQVTPNPLSFGTHEFTSTTSLPVTVTNTGGSDLQITGVSFSAPGDFTWNHVLGACATVAAGGSCSLTIQFQPVATTPQPESASMTLQASVTSPSITVTGTGATSVPCTGATLFAAPSTTVTAGTHVVFTAGSSSCAFPQYTFFLTPPGGSATQISGPSSTNPWTWDTTTYGNGSYVIEVWVSDKGSTVFPETTATVSSVVFTPACASASVTPAHGSPVSIGTSVTYTVSRPGCSAPATYEFWVTGAGLSWEIVQPYSASASWPVNYSMFKGPGTYTVDIWVKDDSSGNSYDTFALSTIVIGDCTSATLSPNPGNLSFTVTPAGTGCAAPQFKYWMVGNGRNWFVARDWSSTPTFDPHSYANLTPGTYTLDAWVRATGSSSEHQLFPHVGSRHGGRAGSRLRRSGARLGGVVARAAGLRHQPRHHPRKLHVVPALRLLALPGGRREVAAASGIRHHGGVHVVHLRLGRGDLQPGGVGQAGVLTGSRRHLRRALIHALRM